MAERSRPERGVGSNTRVRRIRNYEQRVRELTEAFNLPGDVREWVTVRYDPDAQDETLRFAVSLHGEAGKTVTTFDLSGQGHGELRKLLQGLLSEHREDLHARLKADLAVNLMAGLTEGPAGGDE